MGGLGDRRGMSVGPSGGPECPRKLQTRLVDVSQTGNSGYALSLEPGSELDLQVLADDGGVVVTHEGKRIGYLPPQHSVVAECIRSGWRYAASVIEVTGDESAPTVRVLVVGTPP